MFNFLSLDKQRYKTRLDRGCVVFTGNWYINDKDIYQLWRIIFRIDYLGIIKIETNGIAIWGKGKRG